MVASDVPAEAHVEAVYYEGRLDLPRLRAQHPEFPVLSLDPTVVELVAGRYVALTKFGSVIFWNCRRREIDAVQHDIAALPGALERNLDVSDELVVLVGQETNLVTFKEIRLVQLTVDPVSINSRGE